MKKSADLTKVGTTNDTNRQQWLEQVLQDLPGGGRILDAGAGKQRYREFCSHLDYVAQDFDQYDGQGDDKGLQTGDFKLENLDIVGDITDIPEPDQSFDAVLCTEVFEHIPDPLAALKEFARLVKPGGHLIITAPFCSLTHYSPYHFYSGFSRYFYEQHLPANGFEITEFQANGNYFEYLGQEIRRIPSIVHRYTGGIPTKLERMAIRVLLKALERFSANDRGSSELLYFGCHIHAVKRAPAQRQAA